MYLRDRINRGMLFYEHGHNDPIDIQQEKQLQEERDHCKEVVFEYNNTHPREDARRQEIMRSLLGSCGQRFFFEPPVHMSYGNHVHIGENFYSNFNLVLVDDGEIFIGDKVMIGPNVTLCTTGHPVYPLYREMVAHYSLPIRIGNNVWIGAHSVVLPGVTIGDNAVIGAGSIVNRDIPANTVAVGNPCRVLREISERDKEYYFRDLKVDFPYTLRQEKIRRVTIMKYGFGVDLGGTTVKIAYFDEMGTMIHKWEIPTVVANEGRQILPDIADAITQYMEKNSIDRNSILGVGIGVPGPVDGKGMVNKCVNLGWGRFNIADTLSMLVGFPVKAGNDANVAALGEYWKGGGQGCENMILVTLGTGVGGGIIIDGKIINGAHGSGAEIGHLVLNRDETELCGCGKRGCVEQYCSATGIVRIAKKALNATNDQSQLRQYDILTCKDIFDCGKAGDLLANQVMNQYYAYLGEAMANLCDVIDPEVVVLGGGVSKAGQVLLDGVRPYFDQYVFHAARGARFALASLGNDAGAYGAFKLALDAFG